MFDDAAGAGSHPEPARSAGPPAGVAASNAEVEDALVDIEAAEARLVARRAELVREADLRALRDRTRALSTERWLRDRFRLSAREARARVAQADLLLGQPLVHEALTSGELTQEQATVISTALDAVDQIEQVDPQERQAAAEVLLEQAAALDPRDLATAATPAGRAPDPHPHGRRPRRGRAGLP